jgi:hypothetical protein
MNLRARAGLSLAVDPSDGNLKSVRDELIANGAPSDQVEAEYQRVKLMSPDERVRHAHRLAAGGLEHFTGGVSVGNTGSQFVPLRLTGPQAPGYGAPTPTLTQGVGSVDQTISPSQAGDIVYTYEASADDVAAKRATSVGQKIPVTRYEMLTGTGAGALVPPAVRQQQLQLLQPSGGGAGVVNQDGTPVTVKPPRLLNTTPPAPLPVPPIPPANPPPVVTPTAPAPAVSGPGPSVPISSPSVPPAQPPPGPTRSRHGDLLSGGVQTASANALDVPVTGPAAPPSPLVPGDVNAILAGMAGAQNARLPGTQVAGAGAYGRGEAEQVTAKLSQDRLLADSTIQSEYAKNILPYTQSLHLYGRGMTTAPGADFLNDMKGRAGGVLRSLGIATPFDSTKQYDELHKWLTQLVTSTPGAAGSDQHLAATLAGNANTGIHELAGEDMVKVGAALMRMNASVRSEWDTMGPAGQAKYGGYYANYLRDVNKTLDIRAFAEDLYNPHQAKSLYDDLKSHDKAYRDNYFNSLDLARRSGYASPVKAMP